MAVRKPIVLSNGEFQQLQAGDTLGGPVAEVDLISLTNSDAAAAALGEVFYIFGADSVKKAKADAAAKKKTDAKAKADADKKAKADAKAKAAADKKANADVPADLDSK